jgi:hypothetical protein
MALNMECRPPQVMVFLTLLAFLTLSILHSPFNVHLHQRYAQQADLTSVTIGINFSHDFAHLDHGHNHDTNESGKEHNPFDHSHESQHPTQELQQKNLLPLAVWVNNYTPLAVLGHNSRLDRPPRIPLTA